MNDNDKIKFAEIMTGLAEDCSSTLTKAGLEIKYKALKNYTIEQVEVAVLAVMKSNIYTKMPTTGTIIQAIEGTQNDKAEYQYTVVLRAIRELGSCGHPKFKDPITQFLIDNRFGWLPICQKPEKDMEFFARDFKAAYVSQSKNSAAQIDYVPKNVKCVELLKTIGNGGKLLS